MLNRKIEEAEEIGDDLIKDFRIGLPLGAFIILPGLHLFLWIWKRIVDPDSWEVIVTGARLPARRFNRGWAALAMH